MSTSSGDHPAGWWVITPLSLFGFLIGVAILTTRSAYGASDLMMLALLYASLACGLFSFGRLLALGGITFALVGVVGCRGSDTFRWHLLRHNRVVGTPAFHLLSPRVDELEELDWTAHAGGTPIAQAAWQLASGTVDFIAESDQSQALPDVVFVMLDTL